MGAVEKCSVFGGKMDEGYIFAPGGIVWEEKEIRHHLRTISGYKYILPIALIGKNIRALKRRDCNAVISGYRRNEVTGQ